MSRVGKKAIPLPKGVTIVQEREQVRAKGPLGELSVQIKPGFLLHVEDGVIRVAPPEGERNVGALHGATRAVVANVVEGVSKGFSRELEIIGTGYRVSLDGRRLVFKLNYDHPIHFTLPDGIQAEVTERPPKLVVKGIDKNLVGQVAADIRGLQPPEPYKGKGVKYASEVLRRKAGKSSG
jgi:large subunit ribosomal protein L6